MTNDIVNIEIYYDSALEALNKKDYRLAAEMFKACYDAYENAELPVFDQRIKDIGVDAEAQYKDLMNFLYPGSFDESELGH